MRVINKLVHWVVKYARSHESSNTKKSTRIMSHRENRKYYFCVICDDVVLRCFQKVKIRLFCKNNSVSYMYIMLVCLLCYGSVNNGMIGHLVVVQFAISCSI